MSSLFLSCHFVPCLDHSLSRLSVRLSGLSHDAAKLQIHIRPEVYAVKTCTDDLQSACKLAIHAEQDELKKLRSNLKSRHPLNQNLPHDISTSLVAFSWFHWHHSFWRHPKLLSRCGSICPLHLCSETVRRPIDVKNCFKDIRWTRCIYKSFPFWVPQHVQRAL